MDTAATIPTGAMAERWKFSSFVLFSFVIATVIYPVYRQLGLGRRLAVAAGKELRPGPRARRLRGSSVVHMTGRRRSAFVGAKMLGPAHRQVRRGRHAATRSRRTTSRWSCSARSSWRSAGSDSTRARRLSGTDTRIAIVAVNTMLASAAGAFARLCLRVEPLRQARRHLLCNGMLAGLVAITAPCAFVGAPAAIAIGASRAFSLSWSAMFVEQKLKIDDPVGASSVHGVCGAWGVISLGIFANGTYGEGPMASTARSRASRGRLRASSWPS